MILFSDTVLSCSKYGSYVVSGFTRGHVLLWNMACDKTKLLNPFSGEIVVVVPYIRGCTWGEGGREGGREEWREGAHES